jgi:hypothetical protein
MPSSFSKKIIPTRGFHEELVPPGISSKIDGKIFFLQVEI